MKSIISFFKRKKSPEKTKVCLDFLGKILCEILFFTDEENTRLSKLDHQDPRVILEIIKEFIIPNYRYYLPENKEKIKNSLAYYLSIDSPKLKRIFPSFQIPIDDKMAKLFYTLVWRELYGTNAPDSINPEDYEEDCSAQYYNTLTQNGELYKKYNPDGIKPSIENVEARLNKQF